MKYWYFDDYLGPNMIKFLIFHCFYHHHFNAPSWWFHEILNITLLLPLLFEWRFYGANSYSYEIVNISLVLPSSLDGLTYDLYEIFLIEFINILRSPLRPPRTPRMLQRHSKDPLRVPKDLPGIPKDLPIAIRSYQNNFVFRVRCWDHWHNKTFVWGFALG